MKKQPLTLCGNKAEIPTETHLVILCLDYLMDLRRQTDADVLKGKKHLDADFISLAVFALSRSVLRPDYLSLANKKDENIFDPKCTTHHKIPHISKINEEIMTPSKYYPRPSDPNYHDLHPTNLYRFYRLDGLAAGGPHSGPLKLSDLVDAGLKKTNSRCRLEAEKEIVKSSQFELYIQSVTSRGYFRDPTNSGKRSDPKEEDERRARKNQVYKEKYRKAIAKYREKLALNIDHSASADQMEMLSPPHSPSIRMSSPRTPTKSSSRHNNRAFNSPTREAFNSPVRDYPVPSEVHMSPRTHVTSSTRKSKTVGRSTGATSSTPTTSANAATTPLQAKSTKVAATTSPAKVTTNHNRAKVTTTNNSTKGTEITKDFLFSRQSQKELFNI
ncbi:expressed unknown protein [Seminavis robusta]|uniref:Uncharacterized protein n=1 Tax=Seminavis robusta TaxID=568900 RepID=A0A9N8EWA8_9STRA|nr:expressed unknown protein [Seminavis robusta]|eukprot:Sro1795_g298050.1 n/a (387) ;mRNA; f:14283-15514